MSATFATPKMLDEDVPRDGYGRPLIIPPDGGKPIPYTRASSFGGALDDSKGLIDWKSCMALLGAVKSDTIVRAARALTYAEDKRKVRELVEQAVTLAGGGDAATEGTTLHRLTELVDNSEPLPTGLDATTLADVHAYQRVTRLLRPLIAERFVVVDELQVAGTFDRLVEIVADASIPEWLHGRRCISDLKTGGLDYSVGKFAVQLAIYAHGKLYDPKTGERHDINADPNVGIVVHLPQRTGTAGLYALNLDAGWQAAQLALKVRNWRSNARPSNSRFTSDVITQIAAVSA